MAFKPVHLRLEGVDKLLGNLKKFQNVTHENAKRGCKKAGQFLERKSKEIVPVETGALKASGKTTDHSTKDMIEVVVSYGGEAENDAGKKVNVNYELLVHEDAQKRHGAVYNAHYADMIAAGVLKMKGPNQQFKFLEKPFKENQDKMLKIIEDEIKV